MSTSFAIPQVHTTSSWIDFVVESSDNTADDWNFPNITDALSVLSVYIGNATVNEAVVSGTLTDWHPDIAVGEGVKTQWRLSYRKI